MILSEHDDMVQELASHTSDEALRRPILPWALERGAFRSQPEAADRSDDLAREDRIVVQDQEPVHGLIRKRISQLLDHPPGRRVLRDVEVENLPSPVVDDEPDVEELKRTVGTTKKSMPVIKSR